MQIVLRTGLGDREVRLELGLPGTATLVEELAKVVDPMAAAVGSTLRIDGVAARYECSLAAGGLVNGSIVEFGVSGGDSGPAVPPLSRPSLQPSSQGAVHLLVVGGPNSGATHRLSDGANTVGRDRSADIRIADATLSSLHVKVMVHGHRVRIDDLASHNGTFVNGTAVRSETGVRPGELIGMGAVEAVVRQSEVDDRPFGLDPVRAAGDGRLSFNRPPRSAGPANSPEVPVPDPPVEPQRAAAFNVAALIAPLIMAAVMVKVMGSARYALFALMGPVMVTANYVFSRRRHAKDSKTSRRRFRADLDLFRVRLATAGQLEVERREATCPDAAEVVRRCMLPSSRLWERRTGCADYLQLRIGRGPVRWTPRMDERRLEGSPELKEMVALASVVPRCPITIDLSAGGVLGLVGDGPVVRALARSLILQACVLHGPADLRLVVLSSPGLAPQWGWCKWLPHAQSSRVGQSYLSPSTEYSQALMDHFLSRPQAADAPATFVVVDDEALTLGRASPTRAVLSGRAGRIAGLVLAATADRLPAVCDSVVLCDALGAAELQQPQLAQQTKRVVVAGLDAGLARECARQMARLEDPEVHDADTGLPASVTLLSLIGLDCADHESVRRRWDSAPVAAELCVPIGIGRDGVVQLNLVADGPHVLLGGTTGSGKSQLLRSIVGALASRSSPEHLVFVLIDYKGGSAFDECSRLPHTVGMVTDLDQHLGERALRSLEAELRYREELLRRAGASDLLGYMEMGAPHGPMPRLVIVVDEFASMASELPDFVGALVGVAQRGRSLGVHLILATQRPSGAVNANIKANTNARIALRVQDAQDSLDVVGCADAHGISRSNPGRAYIRFGPGEIEAVQTALASGVSPTDHSTQIGVRPFGFGPVDPASAEAVSGDEASDLVRIVDACARAFAKGEHVAPRRPWLEMLPEEVPLMDLLAAHSTDNTQLVGDSQFTGTGVALGLCDAPDRQAQPVFSWQPGTEHLVFVGVVGSGTSSAAVTTVLSAACGSSADNLHVYCIDFGGGSLDALAELSHVGAVVGADERECQVRLVALLAEVVERRRSMPVGERADEPQILLVIDGAPSFVAEFADIDGQETTELFRRIMTDGVAVGVSAVLTADRISALPMAVANTIGRRIMLRQLDEADFSSIGVRARDLPEFVPGRGVDSGSQLVLQLALAEDVISTVSDAQSRWAPACRPPFPVSALPTRVATDVVKGHLVVGEPLLLPVGIADSDRSVASLAVYPGEHIFVAGSARSGVSTTIRALARMLKLAEPDAVMVGVASVRSPLWQDSGLFDALGTVAQLEEVLELARRGDGRKWVVVVDDAHVVEDAAILAGVAAASGECRMVVGGRADELHGQFRHWTRSVRKHGSGLLLAPRLDVDGDLLGVRLPRRISVPLVPGRGFLVTQGQSELVQVAGADLAA